MQHEAGSWHAYYVGNDVKDPALDTNVTCYVANGVWHHYLTTGDTGFLEEFWPVVERAIDYALSHQAETGEIAWRGDQRAPGALLTGSSSIHASIRHAIAIAERLGHERPDWELSLGSARHRDRAPPRTVPRQGPLGDGLVLPDPRRPPARALGPRARRRGMGDLRRPGTRRPLRLRPPLGHRGRDVRVRAWRSTRSVPTHRHATSSPGSSSSARTVAATGPG